MGSRPDKRFGRYEVVAEIGRGAMGAVYKARDPKINRFVAIKAISAISQSPEEEREYRERFFHEAQAAGRLLHPGIVAIFDVGEETETRTPYIVMEYVAGQSLSSLLSGDNNKLPLDIALRLAEELALALDCAHAEGVVHRDIKPANILLTEDGRAKIADFGIAKLNLSNVTLPGHALGTPAYMSPEQVDGMPVDGRSDLFSLGVILYNMVTGHRPFQGTSAVTVCYKVANANPLPATSFDLTLPPELDPVITRAIAKHPAQRFQRGADFARAIRELRESLSREDNIVPGTSATQAVPVVRAAAQASKTAPARPKLSPQWAAAATYLGAASLLASGVLVFIFGIPLHRTPDPKPAIPAAISRPALKRPEPIAPDTVTQIAPPLVRAVSAPATTVPAAKPHPVAKLHPAPAPATPPPAAPAPTVELSRLKIEVQHHFTQGKLSLWVDEKLAYSTDLHGETKTRLAIFHGVQGADSAEVEVPAGAHTLRVNGQSTANDFDESKTITTNFVTGTEKILRVDFEKNNHEMKLILR